jgi:hypothetical protein
MKKIIWCCGGVGLFFISLAGAAEPLKTSFFYGGLIGGYADVDWSNVVTQPGYHNIAVDLSNPYSADGTGFDYGVDLGYQISSHFAVEGQYIRMPTSQLDFDFYGHFGPLEPYVNPYNLTSPTVDSNMDFWSVIFKVMAPIGESGFSLFIDAGPAYQYQTNLIANIGTWAPTFGGGLDYRINQHWFGELGFQYAPGTGKSISNPMIAYIPEIYTETFKLNYIF